MRRFSAGLIVGFLALVGAPATAQPVDPQLSAPEVREDDGKVVVTVTKMHPGRIVYWTLDGCERDYCYVTDGGGIGADKATAPEDYQRASGELVFATPGSQTVTIPIVDDSMAERVELFTFSTNEGDAAAGWPTRRSISVRVIDDDSDASCSGADCSGETPRNPPAASGATMAPTGGRARAPVATESAPGGAAVASIGAPTTTSPTSTVLASDELQRGTGFELTNGHTPQPARQRGGGPRAVALAVPALATGAAAFAGVRRGRRWSPTRP